MIALFARFTFVLSTLFAVLAALLIQQPSNAQVVDDFFRCDAQPCWHGIVPGVTLEDEALPLLTSDPNVSDLSAANYYGFDKWYAWMWSDAYHADSPVIGVWEGGIYFNTEAGSGDVVNRLFLATSLRVGDLWNVYAAPDEFVTLSSYSGAEYLVSLDLRYGPLIANSGFVDCPLTFGQVLQQPVSLWVNANVVRLQVYSTDSPFLDLRRAIITANHRYCGTG